VRLGQVRVFLEGAFHEDNGAGFVAGFVGDAAQAEGGQGGGLGVLDGVGGHHAQGAHGQLVVAHAFGQVSHLGGDGHALAIRVRHQKLIV
jgi:hypothetical protein